MGFKRFRERDLRDKRDIRDARGGSAAIVATAGISPVFRCLSKANPLIHWLILMFVAFGK